MKNQREVVKRAFVIFIKCIKLGFLKDIKAAYTVENAFIIPLFTMIIVALMALAFFMSQRIMMESYSMRAGIEVGMLNKKTIGDNDLGKVNSNLREGISSMGLFSQVKNNNLILEGEDIKVKVTSAFKMSQGFFRLPSNIEVNILGRQHTPATELRKWHAIKSLTEKRDE